MDEQEIRELLSALYVARQTWQIEHDTWKDRKDAILKQVAPQLEAIDAEFEGRLLELGDQVASLETSVCAAVKLHAQSVKGEQLHAVYSKGRTTWDGKKLDGMMALIPQLKEARKEGEPSVSIREVK